MRKVSGKIKMGSQIVIIVQRENTMIKRSARQSLIAKIVGLDNTMIKLNRLIVKAVVPGHIQKYLEAQRVLHVQTHNMAQKLVPAIPATASPVHYIANVKAENAN